MRADIALPPDALGMLLAASTAGYLTSSFSSGRIMARWALIPLGAVTGTGVAIACC